MRGAYIHGEFIRSEKGRKWKNIDPFDLSLLFEWHEDISLVDEVVDASREAFKKWKSVPRSDRIELLLKLKTELEKRQTEIEELIIRETGKARWESQGEAKALAAKIKITLESSLPMIENIERTGSIEKAQSLEFLPRGVCAILGPFNFPLHLANGHIIPALLAGNTVIFKPSEHSVGTASLYAECVAAAGFPPGVFQMLPGAGETGAALVENTEVDAIFFTGSYTVGKKITESLLKTRKNLSTLAALEMGGKNASIVHKDCDLNLALQESLLGAFATAGQRCSCSSRIFVHKSVYSEFREKFVQLSSHINCGDPKKPETFMGSLIHPEIASQFLDKLKRAESEGLKVLLQSEKAIAESSLVKPSVYESPNPIKDVYTFGLQEELFGPNTVLVPYSDYDELVELHEAVDYGLVSSVFTTDRSFFEACDRDLQVGLLNWNRATVGASSQLPFGGLKKSGNSWPAGLFSYFYCAYPRSRLENQEGFDETKIPAPLRSAWESL